MSIALNEGLGFWAGGDLPTKVFELDAGKAASWDATSRYWRNLIDKPADGQAQSYYDFQDISSASEYFPTFHGTVGAASSAEYFIFDGNDFWAIDAIPHGAYLNSLHQDNAAFWLAAAVYVTSAASLSRVFSTAYDPTLGDMGVHLGITGGGAGKPFISVSRMSGSGVLSATADATLSLNAWHVIGVSIDEPSGAGYLYLDGNYTQVGGANTFAATYSSPSGSAINFQTRLMAAAPAGSRMAWIAAGTGAISKAQMDAETLAIRTRLGL